MPLVLAHDADANRRNLIRLCLLRGLLILALLVGAALAQWLQNVPLLRDGGMLLAVFLLTLFNGVTLWQLRRGRGVTEAALFVQLVVDVLLMTLVLYRTGGATNPFVFWYLVPLTIAAATLRMGFTVVLALLTLATYSLLLFHYLPFTPFGNPHAGHAMTLMADDPHAHHQITLQQGSDAGNGFDLHIFGMWINFLLSAGLITFFVSRMSGALREQDHQLAEQQERLLQREQVVALGALAAGAAHELGTPLSTMTVIARDIETDLPADSPLREDVAVLRRQLALCRDILNELRAQAGGEPRRMTLARFVSATVERMEVVHPARQFRLPATFPMQKLAMPAQGLVPPEQTPELASSKPVLAEQELAIAPALQQVFVNLLDNAAQAARNTVEIDVTDEGDFCCINIRDDGPGIAPDIAARLGQPFVSDKPDGLGLGYFLSHASLNPLGGRIEMQTLRQGGTLTRLCLPWRVLRPAGSAV